MGFGSAMNDLIQKLEETTKPDERSVYFSFLYVGFKKAYPEFEASVFAPLCESKIFRGEVGLVVLRICALTRNTYKNPQNVLDVCTNSKYPTLVLEMAGNPSPPGPQIMLYYAPDMLRMGLGEDLEDKSGDNMRAALEALDSIYQLARKGLKGLEAGDHQYQLNVQPAVTVIKNAGKSWKGGIQLRDSLRNACIEHNEMKTEGILAFRASI